MFCFPLQSIPDATRKEIIMFPKIGVLSFVAGSPTETQVICSKLIINWLLFVPFVLFLLFWFATFQQKFVRGKSLQEVWCVFKSVNLAAIIKELSAGFVNICTLLFALLRGTKAFILHSKISTKKKGCQHYFETYRFIVTQMTLFFFVTFSVI